MVAIARGKRLAGDARIEASRRFLKEYEAGASIRTLAARHGVSIGRARTLLLEAGVTFRSRGGRRAPES